MNKHLEVTRKILKEKSGEYQPVLPVIETHCKAVGITYSGTGSKLTTR